MELPQRVSFTTGTDEAEPAGEVHSDSKCLCTSAKFILSRNFRINEVYIYLFFSVFILIAWSRKM